MYEYTNSNFFVQIDSYNLQYRNVSNYKWHTIDDIRENQKTVRYYNIL